MVVVAPGDALAQLPPVGAVRTSRSVVRCGEELRSTQAGTLACTQDSFDVRSDRKRYSAVPKDDVVGVVSAVFSEEYKVDIRSSCPAILPVLAFENATKRNRPFLKVGDLVFAWVVSSHIDMEPEISCVDSNGKAAGYGPLVGGYMFETGSKHVIKLRSRPPPPEIVKLPSTLKWESALGANGRVWVHSSTPKETTAIVEILQDCARLEYVDEVINKHLSLLAMNVTK